MADLIIRYRAGDTGVRPIPNSCGANDSPPPWLSDSLWLSTPDGLTTLPKAKVGQACKINVLLASLNAQFTQDPGTVPLRVQVWVANGWIGVGPVGVPSTSVFAQATPPPVNLAAGVITKNAPDIARVDWTPASTDLDASTIDPATGEAHMCIAANVAWLGSSPASEGALVTSGALNICGNQHHGQRNIQIEPGTGDEARAFRINLSNPGEEEDVFQLLVEERRGRLGRAEREASCRSSGSRSAAGRDGRSSGRTGRRS
jgi:hypothetical protein